MSFSRHGEIYHCDEGHRSEHRWGEGAIPQEHALAHRNDEFPAGYSSAGCSPAVPASASPAGAIILELAPLAKDFAANGKLSLITVSQPRGSLQLVPDFVVRLGDQGVERGEKDDAEEKVGGEASHDDDGKGPLGIRADVVREGGGQ